MKTTPKGNYTYIDGNTVRKLEAASDYRRERVTKEEREREERRRRNKYVAKRHQQKALLMDKGYVMFLTMAVLVIGVISVLYIRIQADLTERMHNISRLESQLSDVMIENEATRKRIETSVDLNHVKDVAVNQLGMVYASPDQIMYYEVSDDDYMNQYSDIPSK